MFLLPTKVPCVGFEFTQTGLIWDCHKGHMVSQGAYGVEEVIHCSAPEPSQLVCPWGNSTVHWGKLHITWGGRIRFHYLSQDAQFPLLSVYWNCFPSKNNSGIKKNLGTETIFGNNPCNSEIAI